MGCYRKYQLTTLGFSGLETDALAELETTGYGLSAEDLELTYTSSERSDSHIPILERLVSSFSRVTLQCGFHSGVDHDPMLQDLKLALLSISQPHDSTLQLVLHADGLHNNPLWSMVDEFIAKNEQLSIRDRFQSKGRGEQLKYVIDLLLPSRTFGVGEDSRMDDDPALFSHYVEFLVPVTRSSRPNEGSIPARGLWMVFPRFSWRKTIQINVFILQTRQVVLRPNRRT
ncbi:hypothetical protein B0H13DRAFT_1855158 [Mycena leptocephala]|nr:hypothetical protein B0H13DRAFT_1855158 [Mycena leptocephala]